MRLVVVDGANVRAATEADADAVDTATLDAGQLNALYERLIGEGNGELVGQFYAEHEHALDAGAEAADEPHAAEADAASAAATAYVAADGAADDWNYDDDVSGLVTVNRVYAADDAHHATTSATSTTEAWAA